jgi:NAD(P)-dependent dehydrogenase (short-subunit alcohol dehydrogenase family)
MSFAPFQDLKDKVCVLTGGAGVIGTALAEQMALAGVKVAILDINAEMAQKNAEEIRQRTGGELLGMKADVLSRESLEEVKQAIHDQWGKVSFLINGAGGNSPKATTQLEEMDEQTKTDMEKSFFGLQMEGFDWVFTLNFQGTLLPSMVFAQDMVEAGAGSIINISSMSAYHPLTKVPAYSAAKSAINNFTEWLATHFAKTGVRVNAIAPGFFLTNQNRFLLTDEKTGELTARGHKIINNTPMARFGEVEELSGTVLYLLSDLSKFVTGVIIPIDGGYNAFSGV